jgi:hypothetical protein
VEQFVMVTNCGKKMLLGACTKAQNGGSKGHAIWKRFMVQSVRERVLRRNYSNAW